MIEVTIRSVIPEDLGRIAEVESLCFPPKEAAPRESFEARIKAFPECFFVAEIGNKIIGFINGCATNCPAIFDEMFYDTSHHIPDGKNQTIFGLAVVPKYQRQGIAAMLMRHFIKVSKDNNRENIILTCKDRLVHYYETFGYVNDGVSGSSHGGSQWYDMILTL